MLKARLTAKTVRSLKRSSQVEFRQYVFINFIREKLCSQVVDETGKHRAPRSKEVVAENASFTGANSVHRSLMIFIVVRFSRIKCLTTLSSLSS